MFLCVLHTGYMSDYMVLVKSINVNELSDEGQFFNDTNSYWSAIISILKNRFPQVHILKLLAFFQPENLNRATPLAMLELSEFLQEDGDKIWLEFAGYKSCV